MKKKHINEATGSGNSGKFKVPLVLATRTWDKEQISPFKDSVSKYLSSTNSYDSYDGNMERSKKIISQNEKKAKKKIAIIKKMENKNSKVDETFIKEDLAVWFGTKKKPRGSKQPVGPWVNICRKKEGGGHPPCGRPEASSKGYPKCRAGGVASKMSDSQKRAACSQKRREEKKDPKIGTGNKPTMTSYKARKESLEKTIRNILKEIYEPKKLYPVESVYMGITNAPRELKQIVSTLKPIPCINDKGEKRSCFRIPEVLYVYFSGNY